MAVRYAALCRKVHVCHCNSLGGATWRSITGRTDRRTDRQTDRRTDRVQRNMRPPPREEGRITNTTAKINATYSFYWLYCSSVDNHKIITCSTTKAVTLPGVPFSSEFITEENSRLWKNWSKKLPLNGKTYRNVSLTVMNGVVVLNVLSRMAVGISNIAISLSNSLGCATSFYFVVVDWTAVKSIKRIN